MTETTVSASTPESGTGDEWRAPDIDRPEGSLTAPEPEMLRGMLAWHRSTLLWKCSGLTAAQLAERSVPPSGLSLLGLIRHLRKVERIWLRTRFAGEPARAAPRLRRGAGAGLRRGRRRDGARGLRGTAHRVERGGSRRRRAKPRRGRRGGRRPVLVALRLPAPHRGVREAQRPRRPRARGRRRCHGGLSHGARRRHRRRHEATTRSARPDPATVRRVRGRVCRPAALLVAVSSPGRGRGAGRTAPRGQTGSGSAGALARGGARPRAASPGVRCGAVVSERRGPRRRPRGRSLARRAAAPSWSTGRRSLTPSRVAARRPTRSTAPSTSASASPSLLRDLGGRTGRPRRARCQRGSAPRHRPVCRRADGQRAATTQLGDPGPRALLGHGPVGRAGSS